MLKTKKHAYAAVMVLGGAALVVDRCILTPSATMPASVAASDRSPRAGIRPPTVTPAPPDAPLSIPELPFPRGLPPWDPRAPIRDLFAPHSEENATDKARSTNAADAGKGTCAAFVKEHHLDAVLLQERLKIAIIDGVWMRIEESVAGFPCRFIFGSQTEEGGHEDGKGIAVRFLGYDPDDRFWPATNLPLDYADSGMDLLLTHVNGRKRGEAGGKSGRPCLLRLPL